MRRNTLYCETPVGLAALSSVDPLGMPEMGECMMLIVAVGIFLATGQAIFKAWGRPAAPYPETQGPMGDSAVAT